MEDLQTILDRVLAGVGEMVAERKAEAFAPRKCAHGHGDREDGRSDARLKRIAGGRGGPGFKSPASAFITDHTAPAGHGTSPKTSAGNNGSEVNALELSGDIHDARTAAIQTTTGVAITAYEIQK